MQILALIMTTGVIAQTIRLITSKHTNQKPKTKMTATQFIDMLEPATGYNSEQIKIKGRKSQKVAARKVCLYLMRQYFYELTYNDLAELMGFVGVGKHTTVLYNLRKHHELLSVNDRITVEKHNEALRIIEGNKAFLNKPETIIYED